MRTIVSGNSVGSSQTAILILNQRLQKRVNDESECFIFAGGVVVFWRARRGAGRGGSCIDRDN